MSFSISQFSRWLIMVWLTDETPINLILTEIIVGSYHHHKLQQAVCKTQTNYSKTEHVKLAASNFLRVAFHKFYLIHYWILYLISSMSKIKVYAICITTFTSITSIVATFRFMHNELLFMLCRTMWKSNLTQQLSLTTSYKMTQSLAGNFHRERNAQSKAEFNKILT